MGLPINAQAIKGGTYLLKSQAACPFQAYAAFRLNAQHLDMPEPGLGADIRGGLVHDALYRVWSELKSQQALIELNEDQMEEMLVKHVSSSIAKLPLAQTIFSDVESQRLINLLRQWLQLEIRRKNFSIARQEFKSSINVKGVEFVVKIDRLDQLDNGQYLIIDYKTGASNASNWLDDRLLDPQIPAYYLALEENVTATAFANLKEMRFDGVSEGDSEIEGIRQVENNNRGRLKAFDSFSRLAEHWQHSLEQLVSEFINGLATVTPSDLRQCTYCARQSLCRLYQQQTIEDGDDDTV